MPSKFPVRAFEQALQTPSQALLQHTPSTQLPDLHSPLFPQIAPTGRLVGGRSTGRVRSGPGPSLATTGASAAPSICASTTLRSPLVASTGVPRSTVDPRSFGVPVSATIAG